MKRTSLYLSLVLVLQLFLSAGVFAKVGDELLDTQAPEWSAKEWFGSKPLTLAELKGRVVLVRFWTGPQCPFCAASVPALNEFYAQYKDQGFTVIGMYHHKSPTPLTKKHVKRLIKKYGFQFPNAIDEDWTNLKKWWLSTPDSKWTSVSFLLDQEGVIRYIHPGGQYIQGDPAYNELKAAIEKLLPSFQ